MTVNPVLDKFLPPDLRLPHVVRADIRSLEDEDILFLLDAEDRLDPLNLPEDRPRWQHGLSYEAYKDELKNQARIRGLRPF